MKTKKSTKANLENKRGLFFQIGTVIVLIAVLAVFEWSVKLTAPPEINYEGGVDITEDFTIITRPEQEQKNTVKPPSIFEPVIVPDNEIILDEPEFLSIEDYPDFVEPVFDAVDEKVDEPIYYKVEIYPKFMGKDDNAFREYILNNIKFPADAVENGLTGKVQVQFVVGTDGKLYDIKLLRKVHPVIDKEVLRVIGESPKWEPAIQQGKYVKAMYGITISFELY